MDIAPAPGEATWRVYDFPPGLTYGLHHLRSVDLDVVIDGSMRLVLDEQEIELHPGDGVVVRPAGHGRRAGERGRASVTRRVGCRLSDPSTVVPGAR